MFLLYYVLMGEFIASWLNPSLSYLDKNFDYLLDSIIPKVTCAHVTFPSSSFIVLDLLCHPEIGSELALNKEEPPQFIKIESSLM